MGDAMNTCILNRVKSILDQPSSEAELNIYLHARDRLNERLEEKVQAVLVEQDADAQPDNMTQVFSDYADTTDMESDGEGYESTGSAGHPHRLDSPFGTLAKKLTF